jgi:predicted O-linked N-acetylglucosamine transferase (SPINDLY family)
MDPRFSLALKYYEKGLTAEAWDALQAAVAEPDADADVLGLAAVLRLDARDFTQALALSERLLASVPAHIGAWLWRAQALLHLGRGEDADGAIAHAATLPTPNPAGWNNLGNLLDDLGRPEAAIAALTRALAEVPDFSLAHNNLGTVLAGQGRFAAAAESHRQALVADPHNLAAATNLGVALLEQGRGAEAIAAFDTVCAADPSNSDAADNRLYAGIYSEADPLVTYGAHAAWGKQMPPTPALRPADPRPSRRLRIGYMSPDFRRHSVSFFIAPILEAHDPAAVETFCYADVPHPDEVTTRLESTAHQWRDVYGLSDDAVFRRVREDQIDILVDLAGHTKGNRLGVFARRAAPGQVTAWGYPATTGLPSMDYRFCDVQTDPAPQADHMSVETLIRLTPGFHCYAPPRDAPPVSELPCLQAGHITFGSFNKLAKISPATVALWAAVLHAVPGSRLLVKTKPLVEAETRASLEQAFAVRGIASSRLELRGWVPDDLGHLNLYNKIDIALDTVPYNGTTTTCEALWMGVPVLTIAGQSHAARVGVSVLTQANMSDWIAGTTDEFASRAAQVAANIPGLAQTRQRLRSRIAESALCDRVAHARGVEAAYRAMWHNAIGVRADQ